MRIINDMLKEIGKIMESFFDELIKTLEMEYNNNLVSLKRGIDPNDEREELR